MKRISLVLLVLVLATSLFFSCDQKEEETGTGVGVPSPSSLPSYEGPIPSDDSTVLSTISWIVSDVSGEADDVSESHGEQLNSETWVSQYDDVVYGYDGGNFRIVGSEREVESDTYSTYSYSWTADATLTFEDYRCVNGYCTIDGVSQFGERESISGNYDTGAYSLSILYEFGFGLSISGENCAGKYLFFMRISASASGTAESERDLEQVPLNVTGYLRIYNNDDQLVREISLSESDMMNLYPGFED